MGFFDNDFQIKLKWYLLGIITEGTLLIILGLITGKFNHLLNGVI